MSRPDDRLNAMVEEGWSHCIRTAAPGTGTLGGSLAGSILTN